MSRESSRPDLLEARPIDRIRYFLLDAYGKSLQKVALHDAWFMHIEQAKRERLHAGILSPYGWGKTWLVVLGYVLDFIGLNPEERVSVVSLSDPMARRRTDAMRKVIESARYQALFPKARPDKGHWQKHEFKLMRTSVAPDPTVQAYGVLSAGTGSRARLIVFDDVDDRKSLNAALREAKLSAVDETWMSRLEPWALALFIATRWHKEDSASSKIGAAGWAWQVAAVSNDFKYLEVIRIPTRLDDAPWPEVKPETVFVQELAQKFRVPVYKLPLWKGHKDEAELKRAYGSTESSKRAWRRGNQQEAHADSERMFPSFESCVRYGIDRHAIPCSFHVSTVDLSTTKRPGNWIGVWGVTADGQKILKELQRGAWKAPETLRRLADVQERYDCMLVLVETNAYQESLLSWANEREIRQKYPALWPKLKGHDTQGNTKSDLEIGVPGLELELENQSLLIAPDRRCDLGCECDWCEYQAQFIGYPHHGEDDAVLMTWFGSIAVGQILKKRRGVTRPTRETIEARKSRILEQRDAARKKLQGQSGDRELTDLEKREQRFRELLAKHDRIAITGPPKCGATTLSRLVRDRRVVHTEAFKGIAWSKVPAAVVDELVGRDRFVVEGVQALRAMKRGLEVDCVVWLAEPLEKLTAKQAALGRQVAKWRGETDVIEL